MIDTQRIRAKILDLAMQGQLTKSLPEDGAAEDLFQKIQEERQGLIRIGRIKNSKPLPEVSAAEVPYEIPNNWMWVRIGSVFYIEMGQSPVGNSVSSNDKGIEFHQGKLYFGAKYLKYSSQKTTMPTKIAQANSVLLCVRAPVGKVNITEREICIGRGLCAITPIWGVEVDFLYYALLSCEKVFVNQATGSTFAAINGDIIKKQIVPLPPLAEQKRIVERIGQAFSILDTIDTLQMQHADNFNTLKNKLIDFAVQGKLTEQLPEDGTAEELYQHIQAEKQALIKAGKIKKEEALPEITADEIPLQIPSNWKWVRFGEISNVIGTGMIRSSSEQFDQADYYYLKMNNIGNFDGKCHFENMVMVNATFDEYEKYKLEVGDFLFNTRNSKELVGKSAAVTRKVDRIILNNNILKIRFLGGVSPEFVTLFFISPMGRSILSSLATSTTNVAAIYQRQLISIVLPLPPVAEQYRVVAKLETVLKALENEGER